MSETTQNDLIIRLPEREDAPLLWSAIERNRSEDNDWNEWFAGFGTLKDVFYFVDRNKQYAQQLFSGSWKSISHPGFQFVLMQPNKCVGMVGFQSIRVNNRLASLGYWVDKHEQGKGLATKATKAIIKTAFKELKLHRLEIECITTNIASMKIAERCGFTLEATLREVERRGDKYFDHVLFRLIDR